MSRLIGFFAILLLLSITVHSAPSCPTVKQEVAPCVTFVKDGADAKPSEECCKGVKNLSVNAANKADKEAVCLCLKQALSTIGTYNPSQVSALPKKCGISLDLPAIDKQTDCTKAE